MLLPLYKILFKTDLEFVTFVSTHVVLVHVTGCNRFFANILFFALQSQLTDNKAFSHDEWGPRGFGDLGRRAIDFQGAWEHW